MEFLKKRQGWDSIKNILRDIGWEVSKFHENCNSTDAGSTRHVKQTTSMNTLIKSIKTSNKEEILKVEKRHIICKGTKKNDNRLFNRKQCKSEDWCSIFKALKEKTCQHRILYPAKMSFKKQRQNQDFFWHIKKLKELITSRLAVQEMLKEIFHAEGKWYAVEIWTYIKEQKLPEMVNMWVNVKEYFLIFNLFKRLMTVYSKNNNNV